MERQQAGIVHRALISVLNDFAAEHGLKFQPTAMRYSPTGFRMTLEAHELDQTGSDKAAKAEWKEWAAILGLKEEDMGIAFVHGGRQFVVAGIRSRARKRPILAKCVADGKTYTFSAVAVKLALGRTVEPWEREVR